MFESFYGMSANPFRLSADERFRFAHRAYLKAWSYLKYAIEQGEGFVLITGRPGTGKTTLIRDILSELDESKILAVNLVTNQFQSEELLRMVALNFGFDAYDYNKAMLLTSISEYAMEQYVVGRRVIIIVDEAQNLTDGGLEELRLISNLQVGNQSLFQIFLIGQEELRSLIYGQGLENIRQRIVASCRVEPMDVHQTEGYIEHRLGVVGWNNDPELDAAIYPLIQRLTHGVPREVNHIVGRLLLYGALEEKHKLTQDDLWVIVKELSREQRMGFELEEDMTSFKRWQADKPPNTESAEAEAPELGQPAAQVTAEKVEDKIPEAAATDTTPGSTANEIAIDSEPAEETADDREREKETEMADGFDATDALLRERVDEDATTFGMSGMYAKADERDQIGELPSIEMTRRYNPHEPKHSYLLTDVDDLLDENLAFSRGFGRIWRWLFYPSAIAVLLLMIFGPKPDQILSYWAQTWSRFQQTYLTSADELAARQPSTVQAVKPAALAQEAESGQTPTDVTTAGDVRSTVARGDEQALGSSPAPETHSTGSAVAETPAVESSPAETAAVTAPPSEPETAQTPASEPETAQKPPVESTPSRTAESAIETVGGLIDYDRTYHLTVDEETGELTTASRQLFLSALDLLRANQKALLIVTGISGSTASPIEGMRTALKEANMAATLFLEAGVEQARISIEGGRPEGVWERAIKSGDNPQMANLRAVRFKVVRAPDNS
jgi:type II secretory pathway predicted ATPase ExeA